jgi:lipopolysaccharide/colanic/teichoic acid biosynthesis glycosyltransferase
MKHDLLLIHNPRLRRLLVRLHILQCNVTIQSRAIAKRIIDLCVVVPAVVALSPLLAIVALLIKLHDRGPVLFWQARIGQYGKPFPFPKFRSMIVDAERVRKEIEQQNQHGAEGVTFKMKRDPRITPIGRFIRRFSIDELPQLWCVLKGDMALVGPRPPIPSEVAKYNLYDRNRLSVKPGLTCTWQVGGRSEIPFEQQVDMDIEYIQQQTTAQDVKLLLKTIPAVIKGRGAY